MISLYVKHVSVIFAYAIALISNTLSKTFSGILINDVSLGQNFQSPVKMRKEKNSLLSPKSAWANILLCPVFSVFCKI